MNKSLHQLIIRIFLTGMFLLCIATAWAQTATFQNGIRKGMIKVKFSPAAAVTIDQAPVNARGTKLTTGIQNVDLVASKVKASGMQRLFPYDARFENKLRKHGLDLWYIVEIDTDVDPKTAVAQFKQLKEVSVAEVDYEKKISPYTVKTYSPGINTSGALPFNDPLLKDQWHYNNTGQTGYSDADINLFEAWTQTTGANDIIVSVHDEGVDVKHNDLKANIWVNQAEFNGSPNVDDDGNGYVDDINGYNFAKGKGAVDAQYHGTHVAGTIAAVNNNGIGVSGVAGGNGSGNGVKIMSLQIMGDNAAVEKSYVYAANNGAVISQNSWGYSNTGSFEQVVLDAIDYFVEEAGDYEGSPMKGGIVIFAAGNMNSDANWYPQIHPNTFAVASIGPEWIKASYSNFGPWVEVSAPGGDSGSKYGSKGGVLSTIPNNQYAYLDGTSMACPHVSGIAALALANRTHQLTNEELKFKLLTGVVGIDEHNEAHAGKLGKGAIDASLAIQNDQGIAPVAISNLAVTGVAQEFATFKWSVPADTDDGKPVTFDLYYHTQPITSANLGVAGKATIKNTLSAGSQFTYELTNLLGLTTYHFAITSTDRWGNVSVISNAVSATTNAGPSISVGDASEGITFEIDAAIATSGTRDITIKNNAAGILRWNHFTRQTNPTFNAAALHYPVASSKKFTESKVAMRNSTIGNEKESLKSNEIETSAFEHARKVYAEWPFSIIGETELQLTNSAAAKFNVTETSGFNLTQVEMLLKHDAELGPVIMEVYKGSAPTKNNLVYAQEHNNGGTDEAFAWITLDEQLYFEHGSTFWIVFHVPAGNLYPLGVGFETESSYSQNCFMSNNMGSTWFPLEDVARTTIAWAISAYSNNEHFGTYLTLEPGSGDVNSSEQTVTTLTVDAATLVNGNYNSNLVITSNDAENRELRIPVSLTVSGHKPKIKHTSIADYGSVFIGKEKTLELVLENTGYGDITDLLFTIDHADFSIVDNNTPWSIQARSEERIQVKFTPTSSGNINGVLAFTNGDQSYQVSLFGVGTEAPKIAVSPESQVINDVTIGDVVNAQITVENTGAYPLEYFIPGRDTKGISDNWPFEYHTYGYQIRSNYATDADPIPYEFQDISSTGVDITNQLVSDRVYAEVDMGFDFPYYGETKSKIYIAQKGFTTFDNSVRPLNDPGLWGSRPAGYISVIGTVLKYIAQGKIYYQLEADRMIIQFDNVTNGLGSTATAQMVLYASGNIRFFYEQISLDPTYLNILIEDVAMKDGIQLNGFRKDHDIKLIELYDGLALGFDYPGPNIIKSTENSSGVLSPGSSAIVNIELATASMGEGITNKAITFISNDPFHPLTKATIQLEVTDGGIPNAEISTDAIAFGNVFQGATKSAKFTIKNSGTANVEVTSMTLADDEFIIQGDIPATITPGSYKTYEVEIPTATLATLDDLLTINYAEGSPHEIHLTGTVVDAPAINVDLSLLQQTLEYGSDVNIPFTIENTGLGTLEVTTTGKQWLSFETPTAASDVNYTYEKHNTGGVYQWIDILKTGTHLPFLDYDDESTYWRTLTLPFPVEFYGEKYSSMKVGENGIISFEADPPTALNESHLPNETLTGPCVMPYWTFSGFRDSDYPKSEIGIFYQYYSDKIVITWSYFYNRFSMGDPVSAQIIFYKNGTMKFQYKPTEDGEDATSRVSAIGLQRDINKGLIISDHLDLDYGQGLAYMVIPVKTHSIAPATTLSGEINLDAKNIYGGVYYEALKIQTNAPNNEQLEKPIELTVTGDAVIDMLAEVDFGKKMIVLNQWGDPEYYYVDLNIGNKGSALLDITWAQMAVGLQGLSFEIFTFSEGPWGGWFYSDISNIWGWDSPVMTITPGSSIKARAVFAPNAPGAFADEIVLTTNIGEIRVPLSGVGIEPPVMNVTTTSINVVMNTLSEKVNKSILFDNEEGASDLEYKVSIDFGRATTARKTSETINTNSVQPSTLRSTNAQASGNAARTQATYNRTLKHTPKGSPDTFVGIGTAGTFRVATKYNAGAQGFNLSHVETWFRRATLTTGTILVEIRAGGSSIADAALVGEGSLQFSGAASDNAGSWHAIKLDKPTGIYPNEDFYVIITYPLGIDYPQGTVNDEPTIADRYYYFNFEKGEWSDIQKIATFETMGWLMFAAEETAGNSSWLTVTSPLSGTVATGQGSNVELLIEGAYSQRGDQIANILIVSNDPENDTVRIPVKLHMNEAPLFSKAPESIYVEEGKTLTVNLTVTDKEGNNYSVAATKAYPWLTHTFTNGALALTLKPTYGSAGNYTVVFTATDEHNAERELSIPVEIAHTNRAPQFIGENGSMSFNATGLLNQFAIADFFSDPDGDKFTFTLANSNSSSVVTFASEEQFIIRPIAAGESKLAFTVTDSHGAITKDTLTVTVDIVLGAEEEFQNDGLGIYPNPAVDHATMTVTNDWTGEVILTVVDVNGKQYLTQNLDTANAHETKVDVSKLTKGIYILHAISDTRRASIKLIKK